MMTDQQRKFYFRIGLLSQSISITEMEKSNLMRAKKWLDRGDDFHIVINSLCLGFQSLKAERLQGNLSPAVDKLFEELISVYGKPQKSKTRIGGGGVPLIFP